MALAHEFREEIPRLDSGKITTLLKQASYFMGGNWNHRAHEI
jgi:hypothetical protein